MYLIIDVSLIVYLSSVWATPRSRSHGVNVPRIAVEARAADHLTGPTTCLARLLDAALLAQQTRDQLRPSTRRTWSGRWRCEVKRVFELS